MKNNNLLSMIIIAGVAWLLLASCSSSSSFFRMETPNQNDRFRTVVIHYTAVNENETMKLFNDANTEVSAHFVVTEDDIYQLADIERRTYHAGVSFWRGRHSLNDTSIGIELVQEVNCLELESDKGKQTTQTCVYPDFSPKQIRNLIKVLEHIYEQYPEISPLSIVGHQDIAPSRKLDPSSRFPWQYLSEQGYGEWYDSQDYFEEYHKLAGMDLDEGIFYQAILLYGYQETAKHKDLFKAFQSHFTPSLVTGEVTREGMAAILALLKKYKNDDYHLILDNLYFTFQASEPDSDNH